MVAATSDANELRILALAGHLTAAMWLQLILLLTVLRADHSQGEARVAELPSRSW